MARTEQQKRPSRGGEALCIEGLQNDFVVVHARDMPPGYESLAIPAQEAALVLQFAFEHRSPVRADFVGVCERLDGFKPWGFALPGEDESFAVRQRIERALETGELVALRFEARRVALLRELMELDAAEDSDEPPPPAQKPPSQEEKPQHWYEIRVIDEAGAPVPGARLKLDIQGTPRTSSTDPTGKAHLDWFDGGTAKVAMSNLQEMEDLVSKRWQVHRERVQPPGGALFHTLGETWEDLSILSETPAVLVLVQPATWIEVVLQDPDGKPLSDQNVLIQQGEEEPRRLRTDAEGKVRLDRLDPGKANISFPDLDEPEVEPQSGQQGT
jgi:hypothetical protein